MTPQRELLFPVWEIEDDGDCVVVTLTAEGMAIRACFTVPDAETFAADLATAAAFNNASDSNVELTAKEVL